ncbi:MAG: hypothetical protein HYX24_05350 [Candidatus Aenigmarchaeota archaeon]|nr:hypothetical protein [Candidatus Aenigmarchaeota archaeon]
MRSLTIPINIALIIFFSGCIDTTQPIIGSPDVSISKPYNILPNEIEMKIDTSINIPITNTRQEEIDVEILEATITAKGKDGKDSTIYGGTTETKIFPLETKNISIVFIQIPLSYILKDNPLRLESDFYSYDIRVRYRAKTSMFFKMIPYEKEDFYQKTVISKDIPINESVFSTFRFD